MNPQNNAQNNGLLKDFYPEGAMQTPIGDALKKRSDKLKEKISGEKPESDET